MTSANKSRESIERLLRERLERAQHAYDSAVAKTHECSALLRDVGFGTADGTLALRQSEREHRRAAAAYRKALAEFTAFVVDGILPDGFDRDATH